LAAVKDGQMCLHQIIQGYRRGNLDLPDPFCCAFRSE
jgi:hypothetical protein